MSSEHRISLRGILRNAFPAPAARSQIDLTASQMDTLVKYQLGLPHPLHLEEHSLIWAGVVQKERQAADLHRLLVKHGYVVPPPPRGAPAGAVAPWPLTVDTNRIDRSFARQFPALSPFAHRRLVCLLFFWEEEVNRWWMLKREEDTIREALDQATAGHAVQDLSIALQAVVLKTRLLPSERAEGTTSVIPPQQEALPSYSEAA